MASVAVRFLQRSSFGGRNGIVSVAASGSRAKFLPTVVGRRTFAEKAAGTGGGQEGSSGSSGSGKVLSAVIGAALGAGGYYIFQNWQQGCKYFFSYL